MSKTNKYLVIDCESIGLYGDTFAVAAVLSNNKGKILEVFHCACMVQGVLSQLDRITFFTEGEGKKVVSECKKLNQVESLKELRDSFWKFYMKCVSHVRETNDKLQVYGDVIFPVESNFLAAVAKDNLEDRQFLMPYPLMDVANSVDVNIDRIDKYIKENAYYIVCDVANRKPIKHNPLWDVKTSLWALMN